MIISGPRVFHSLRTSIGAWHKELLIAVLTAQAMAHAASVEGAFTIGTNFTGSSFIASGFRPPDTMGGVGPDHIVELINGRFAVYNRSGVLQTSSSLDAFWINKAGVTPSGSFSFDPRIIYDQYSGRWFATSVDNAGGNNNFLVGVSNTSNPSLGWTGYKIDSDPTNNSHWADFPMMGLNQDVLTISANMFPLSGGSTQTSFLVIDKAALITGGAPISTFSTLFEDAGVSNTGFTPQPVWDQDNGNLPQAILSAFNKPGGLLKTSSVTGTAASPSLNTTGGFINVTSRSAPPDIDQPGSEPDIDAGDTRFSGNVVQQQISGRTNPSLWGVHGVNIGGRAAIEWYEIDAVTNALLQSGTISDSSLAFNYPSIAVNDSGDVVIGFSGGDPMMFMSTYFAGGRTVEGITNFGPVTLTKAGVADYDGVVEGRNRWGDYSATVVDPMDSSRFWTFQEWAAAPAAANTWRIQITEIVIPEPTTFGWFTLATFAWVVINGTRKGEVI